MSSWQMKTPVAFFIFNRPDTTERVFAEIRRAAPPMLLLIADGPRHSREGEAARCAAARDIATRVDWPCEVLTDFSETNLGCRRRVASGLDWVFSLVDEAIILEDDCLPDPSFFRFCEELLQRYRHDERVFMISGDNFQFGNRRTPHSYYFSRYPHIWGWACWSRSWRRYDPEMKMWPEIRDGGWLKDYFGAGDAVRFWERIFEDAYRGRIDAWSHQFTFACLVHHGLCVVPNVNLVSNIGFQRDATHTRAPSRISDIPVQHVSFPLQHPGYFLRDTRADRFTEKEQFVYASLPVRIARRLAALCRNRG